MSDHASDHANQELRERCEQVVVELTSRYDWRLLAPDTFVRIVLERAQDAACPSQGQPTKAAIAQIVKNEYALTLYDACRPRAGAEHLSRLRRGYEELGRYLYDIAYHKCSGRSQGAEDATQKALLDIYRALSNDQCRAPGAFLAFSINKLRGALTWVERSHRVGGKTPLALDDAATGPTVFRATEDPAASPAGQINQQLLSEAIWAELQHKYQKHPRATQQLTAVILRHAFDYSIQEIAEALNSKSAGTVSTLLSRGKKKLANNQEFRELAIQMLSRLDD